jgi:DNA-binding XRE family transcriptional regulator
MAHGVPARATGGRSPERSYTPEFTCSKVWNVKILRTLRAQKGLTQKQVAKKARVTEFYVSQLETGLRRNPSLAVLRRLATALGVPVARLLK